MLLTYKYKLYKTKKTKHIDEFINIACSVYNHCIALHKRYYKLYHKSLNKARLQKHLTKLKKLDKYKHWSKLGSQAIQQITERIDNAYKKFFKRLGGLPSFKKRIKYKSFTLKGSVGYKLKDNIIFFNGYNFKFSKNQKILAGDEIKTVTIKRDNLGSFYICVSLKTKDKENITTGKSVGIDFGLKTFLTFSDNMTIKSPLIYLKSLKELKAKQRKLSSKKIGSNNRKKAKLELAKFHIKLANQRKDYFFKLANILAKKYDNVFIEDLNLKAMAKIWGRKINDLAYSEFISILATKTNVVKIDKFYPSSKTCSCCGYVKKDLNLKDRVFDCPKCNTKIDRDYNASLNIFRVGASTLSGEFVRPAKVG
ncbi:RNA-guided endonuclease InsQ/TnpB family protein [Campylobacter coli]